MKIHILFFFLFLSVLGYTQSDEDIKTIDSLKKAIGVEKQDTSKAKTLVLIAKMHTEIDPKIAIQYLNQAKVLIANTSNNKILSDIANQLGTNYYYLGDFNSSLKYFLELMNIAERQNNLLGIATAHNNIGSIYFELNDTTNALKHHLEALKIRQKHEKNDNNGKNQIAMSYGNVGKAYFAMNNYVKAMEYYQLALNLSKELGNKQREALMLNNIGSILAEQKKYDEAYPNFVNAYNIYLEADSPEKIALCLNNIAEIHYRKGEYEKSIDQYKNSLIYSKKVSALDDIKTSYEGLKNCYTELDDYKGAYVYLQKYFTLKDSIFGEESTMQMNELLAKFDSDKKEQEIKLLQKEKEMSSWLRNSLVVGFALLVLLAFALYSRNKVKQKANIELSIKNKNIEEQKQIVEEQKLILEVHQKEIVDSINYAKRIQQALLKQDDFLKQNLKEYFIFFQSKDIVSGDFYWSAKINKLQAEKGKKFATVESDLFYLTVSDSTGHGVPGAFMSLLNMAFLSEAINEREITRPNEVLNYVRERLITTVSADGGKDGMDAILLCINQTLNIVTYCAANNTPVLIRNNEIIELAKDKMPVGKGEKIDSFTLHEIEAQENDVLYLYTDGYADQFGGEKGKKFKYKPLNELLLSIHHKPMPEQQDILKTNFNNWKGNLEQIDDVCIIGIKL